MISRGTSTVFVSRPGVRSRIQPAGRPYSGHTRSDRGLSAAMREADQAHRVGCGQPIIQGGTCCGTTECPTGSSVGGRLVTARGHRARCTSRVHVRANAPAATGAISSVCPRDSSARRPSNCSRNSGTSVFNSGTNVQCSGSFGNTSLSRTMAMLTLIIVSAWISSSDEPTPSTPANRYRAPSSRSDPCLG